MRKPIGLRKFSIVILAVLMAVQALFVATPVHAAVTAVSAMGRSNVAGDGASDPFFEVQFTTAAGFATGDPVTLTFPAGMLVTGANRLVAADVHLSPGGSFTAATVDPVVSAPSGGRQSLLITSPVDVPPGATVTIHLVGKFSGPNFVAHTVVNPATPGTYNIGVSTPTEPEVTGPYVVSPSPPLFITLAPNSLPVGYDATSLAVTGSGTHFAAGATTLAIMDGSNADVTGASALSVTDATDAVVNLAVGLPVGGYTLHLITGAEDVSAPLVITAPPLPYWPVCAPPTTQNCIQDFQLDGAPAPATLLLQVLNSGDLQIQVKYDPTQNGFSNYDLLAPGSPVTAGSTIHVALNIGSMDPVAFVAAGDITSYTYNLNPTTGNTISFDAKPHPSSWSTTGCSIGACGDDTTRADVDHGGMLIASLSSLDMPPGLPPDQQAAMESFRNNARGAWVATNAQSFSMPRYDAATHAFVFDLAAPHLTAGGAPNTGFFKAFLPNRLLTDLWGIADPASVTTQSLSTTRRDGAVSTPVTPTVAPAAGGVLVQLAAFSYSSPTFSIAPADRTPPIVTMTAPVSGTVTKAARVTFTATAADDVGVADVKFEMSQDGGATWFDAGAPLSGPYTMTTDPLTEGTYQVRAVATDTSGNAATSAAVSFTVDTTPPSGAQININNGATVTNNRQVTLALTATDPNGPLQMMLSENATFTGANWEAFATTRTWTLSAGDGARTVYARFRDNAGNVSSTVSAAITVDTVKPGVTAPLDNAADIGIGGFSIQFSEDVNPASLTTATITLTDDANSPVTITLGAYDSATHRIGVTASLNHATHYRLHLSAGILDRAGNSLDPVTLGLTTVAAPVVAPPPDRVTISAAATLTREAVVTVSGTANPGAAVRVGGTVVTADAQGNWSATVSLQEGANTITATAGSASQSVTVTRKSLPPVVQLTAAKLLTTDDKVLLTATSESDAAISINGQPVGTGTGSLTVSLAVGMNTFTATATDRLGNQGTATVTVERVPVPRSEPTTQTVTPDAPAQVKTSEVVVELPAGVSDQPLVLNVQAPARTDAVENLRPLVTAVAVVAEINASQQRDNAPVHALHKRVKLTFSYNPAVVADPSQLKAFYYDPAGKAWVELGGAVDPEQHTVTVEVDHFTLFAVIAPQAPAPVLNPLPATTTQSTLTVSGQAARGSTVTLMHNGAAAGTAVVGSDGTFSLTATLVTGRNSLYVKGGEALASREAVITYQPAPPPAPQPTPAPAPVPPTPEPPHFADMAGHWAEAAVRRMASLGVVNGYEDHTFRPEGEVSRLEFAAMVARALQLPDSDGRLSFRDQAQIPDWARGLVAAAVKAGIVQGRDDGRFDPNAPVTRSEVAVMLARALKFKGTTGQPVSIPDFADAGQLPGWAADSVAMVAQFRLVTGYEDGTFRPANRTTRAEAAVMLSRLLDSH